MLDQNHEPQRWICRNPFEWFEIHADGQVFACCPSWLKRPLGNLLSDPLDEIWNGTTARQLRQSIHDGSFRHCNRQRCPRLVRHASPVVPLAGLQDEAFAAIFESRRTLLPWGPRTLNLCYDRSCNLACPSCRKSFWVASGTERQRALQITERIQSDLAGQTRKLILSGSGDPFAGEAYRRLLEDFVPADYPQLESIHLHSNGLLWNPAAWETLAVAGKFVRSAEISVDAASPATYAINRGGDFERLLENLSFLAGLPMAITLSFVVQQNNYREMPDFVDLARGFGFSVYFSQLVNWGTFRRDEFRRRAVHLPDHPENELFRSLLEQMAPLKGVDIGNLGSVLRQAREGGGG